MVAPIAIWVEEKGFSKDIHFFRHKIYLSFHIGFMRRGGDAVSLRHQSSRKLLQSRPLLARLFL